MPFVPATKEALKLRLAIAGAAGAGKTWTGLSIAEELAPEGKIAGLDTERGSMSLYVGRYKFDTQRLAPPYDPQLVIDAVKEAEKGGYEVLLIDSLTHFWQGEGGVLSRVDAAKARYGGNSFMAWAVGTPLYQRMIDTILGADLHVICTLRSKQEYEEVVNERGGKTYERVGTAPVMREGIEYEFTVTVSVNLEHQIVVDKTRCHLLSGRTFQPHQEKDIAIILRDWLADGEPPAPREVVESLRAQLNGIPGEDRRKDAKVAFFKDFGQPEFLRMVDLGRAQAFVDNVLGGGYVPPRRPESDEGSAPPPEEPHGPRTQAPAPAAPTVKACDICRAVGEHFAGCPNDTVPLGGQSEPEAQYDPARDPYLPHATGAPAGEAGTEGPGEETGDQGAGEPPTPAPDTGKPLTGPATAEAMQERIAQMTGGTRAPVSAPSLRDIEAAGGTPEDIAEAEEKVKAMDGKALMAALREREMSIQGTVSDRRKRLVQKLAEETVAARHAEELARPPADIHPLYPESAGVAEPQGLLGPVAITKGQAEGGCKHEGCRNEPEFITPAGEYCEEHVEESLSGQPA